MVTVHPFQEIKSQELQGVVGNAVTRLAQNRPNRLDWDNGSVLPIHLKRINGSNYNYPVRCGAELGINIILHNTKTLKSSTSTGNPLTGVSNPFFINGSHLKKNVSISLDSVVPILA